MPDNTSAAQSDSAGTFTALPAGAAESSTFYRPKFFTLVELAPPELIARYGETTWQFFEPRLLWTLDTMREYFGVPLLVNRDRMVYRGLRPPGFDLRHGVYMSCHEQGKAADFDVEGMTAEAVRQTILLNKDAIPFKHITRMERDVSWVHIDIFNVADRLILF